MTLSKHRAQGPADAATVKERDNVMTPSYLKKFFIVMVPVAIIAFLIISISFTFGQSDAGIAMGVLEGCLIVFIGLVVVFFAPIKKLSLKALTKVRSLNKRNSKQGNE